MKSLIIYFSHTGENYMENGIEDIKVGNTEKLAKMLSTLIPSDLFKVEPIDSYPYSYEECCDVAKKELNEDYRPKLKNYLEDIKAYDTIYIMGPVWWGHYPMAMFSLLENLDFTGKKVRFITTHEGSGLGSVPEDIKKLCDGADTKGIAVRGCKVDTALENLKEFIK